MIKVLSSSFGLSIQDLGRTGFASYGVSSSGAMDQYASKLANTLLNNNENDAVLEITNGGCMLEFKTNTSICLTGADYSAKINGHLIELNKVVEIKKESILSFSRKIYGFRTYLAVKNGFKTKPILKSRSMFATITTNAVLKKADLLPIESVVFGQNQPLSKIKVDITYFTTNLIDCYKGPEFEMLDKTQQNMLLERGFKISINNNRMGYQLEERIENTLPSMLTSSVLPGTVQLTPFGKLIVLMRDCQVTGGYPRILQLSETSINTLAQKSTYENIQFNLL